MTTDEIIEESLPLEQPEDAGPGELLGRKREALGLGIRQVADDLHITMHYVRALESNAFDKLPGDVFVRGYIRSYANLLHLDPQMVISIYNDYTNQRRSTEEQAYQVLARRRGDRNLPWVLISGIAFVVIAVALWFFGAGGSEQTATTATQGNAPANVGNGTAATLENVGTSLASDPVTLFEETIVVSQTDEMALQPEPLEQNELAVDEALPTDGEPAVDSDSAATELPAQSQPQPQEQQSAPAVSATPAADDPAVLAGRLISIEAGGTDVVQMVFKGISSVQVDDGSDKQIYRDTRGAGDVLRINGSAPFDISLGDAGAVELSLNGDPVDFSGSIRIDNSARLTIGL